MTRTKKGDKVHAVQANSGEIAISQSDSTDGLIATRTCEAAQQPYQDGGCPPCQDQPIDRFNMAVRELAYLKWEAAGFPSGDGFDFWLEAEREVKANRAASDTASK
jgi:hypothetical protein